MGITSRGNVLDILNLFDPERYAPLNWANPTPDRIAPADAPTEGPFRFRADQEMGLFWDMKLPCDAGIVQGRKEGEWVDYSLDPAGADHAKDLLHQAKRFVPDDQKDCSCSEED